MIVKVKTDCGWTLFDGADRLDYRHYQRKEHLGVRQDVFDYTNNKPGDNTIITSDDDYCIELWVYSKKDNDPIQILARSPVYILNNNGRTIETI